MAPQARDAPDQPILVVGPGAIGAIVAARLGAAGHPVTVACRTKETAETVAKRGVFARDSAGHRIHGNVKTILEPEELTEEPVLAVVATKCADAEGAMRTWCPELSLKTPVVAMQNGLMGDALLDAAGGRLVECVVAFPATLHDTGDSEQTGSGDFIVGPWPVEGDREEIPRPTPRQLKLVARVLGKVVPTRIEANILGAKWSKLIINSCITTLGVVTGRDLGDLLRDPHARDLFLAITAEGTRAGAADGVRFDKVAGFTPDLFAYRNGSTPLGRWRRHVMLRLVGRKARRQRSSSLQSLQRGQKSEVGYLNGVIVETAKRHGIDSPVNDALLALVADIEAGTLEPGMEHLRKIAV